jgi:hypothetical protein
VPSLSEATLATCGVADVTGVIVGRVGLRNGELLPSAVNVVAEWRHESAGNDSGSRAPDVVRSLRARTDPRGTFRLCGVPANTALTLRAEPDAGFPATMVPVAVTVNGNRRFARADLVLDRPPRKTPFHSEKPR